MKELLRRSFFGLLYVMTVVFALQYFESKAVLLLVFMIIGLKEFSSLIQLHFNTALLPSVFIFIFSYIMKYRNSLSHNKIPPTKNVKKQQKEQLYRSLHQYENIT